MSGTLTEHLMYTKHYPTTGNIAENEAGKVSTFRDLIFSWEERSVYKYVVCEMVMSAMGKKNN